MNVAVDATSHHIIGDNRSTTTVILITIVTTVKIVIITTNIGYGQINNAIGWTELHSIA